MGMVQNFNRNGITLTGDIELRTEKHITAAFTFNNGSIVYS